MNVNMPSTAAWGRTAGNLTCQNVRSTEQPSTRAASMSSNGTVSSHAWRIQNTANDPISTGTMTACSVPYQSRSDISMYSGITPSCVGTIAVPSTTRNSESRPLNRRRANANPASVPSTTLEIATLDATMNEFCMASQKSTVSKTRG